MRNNSKTKHVEKKILIISNNKNNNYNSNNNDLKYGITDWKRSKL